MFPEREAVEPHQPWTNDQWQELSVNQPLHHANHDFPSRLQSHDFHYDIMLYGHMTSTMTSCYMVT